MPPRGSGGYDFTPVVTHYGILLTSLLVSDRLTFSFYSLSLYDYIGSSAFYSLILPNTLDLILF